MSLVLLVVIVDVPVGKSRIMFMLESSCLHDDIHTGMSSIS